MTGFSVKPRAKQTLRMPLADKANILNMKLSRIKEHEAASKRKLSTTSLQTPVKKRGRKTKRNILPNANVYPSDVPITYESENKLKRKRQLLVKGSNAIDKKELFVKIIPIPINGNGKINAEVILNKENDETMAKTSTIDFNTVLRKNDGNKKKTQPISNLKSNQMVSGGNEMSKGNAKELIVKIPQLKFNPKTRGVKECHNLLNLQPKYSAEHCIINRVTDVPKDHNISLNKPVINLDNKEKAEHLSHQMVNNLNTRNKGNCKELVVMIPQLKFKLKATTDVKESRNLRNLQPKNYAEDSIIDRIYDVSKESSIKSLNEPALNLVKKDRLPIYRNLIPDEPKTIDIQDDLYEFVDVSPKKTKQRLGPRKSSIFDINTHEILQKIEEKEAKAKKKYFRKKRNVLKPAIKKTYDKKINTIVSNIRMKICKKTEGHLETTEKINGKQNLNNKNNAVQLSKGGVTNKPHINSFDKLKELVEVRQCTPAPIPLDTISVCSDSDIFDSQDANDSYSPTHENVPLNDSHTRSHIKAIHINNFSDEFSIIVHHSSDVPLHSQKCVPQRANIDRTIKNVASRRGENTDMILSSNSVHNNNLSTSSRVLTHNPHSDTFDNLRESVGTIRPILPPKPLNTKHDTDSDNLSIQNDIDSFFGFENVDDPSVVSTPNKDVTKERAVKILGNIVIRHETKNDESPVDFTARRPNANSTMIHTVTQNKTLSPWRSNWVNRRVNPHFVSIKSNALPRIHQEPVLEHTLVEGFEGNCKQKEVDVTPEKKSPVQQSILDFVVGGIEIQNQPLQGSLYDYEAFNSPVKKKKRGKENQRVEAVKRNLGNKDNIVSSTPIQRRILGDISNSSGEPIFVNSSPDDNTYFGFNESSLRRKTPEKVKNKDCLETVENINKAKPSRFDHNALRSYATKGRNTKNVLIGEEKQKALQVPDDSISLVELTSQDNDNIHLFDEPEDMLDTRLENTSPVLITEKKHRRRDSCNFGMENNEKKRKRHKTQLEIEQERWIEEFNEMCAKVDEHELEVI